MPRLHRRRRGGATRGWSRRRAHVSRKSCRETYSSSNRGFCNISIGRSRPAGLALPAGQRGVRGAPPPGTATPTDRAGCGWLRLAAIPEQSHVVGAERLGHRLDVLEVGGRADGAAEDLEERAAERPPVRRHRDLLERLHVAARELGRLVPLGEELLEVVDVAVVELVGADEELEAAELPVHALVDEDRGDAHLRRFGAGVRVGGRARGGAGKGGWG